MCVVSWAFLTKRCYVLAVGPFTCSYAQWVMFMLSFSPHSHCISSHQRLHSTIPILQGEYLSGIKIISLIAFWSKIHRVFFSKLCAGLCFPFQKIVFTVPSSVCSAIACFALVWLSIWDVLSCPSTRKSCHCVPAMTASWPTGRGGWSVWREGQRRSEYTQWCNTIHRCDT